MVAELVHSATLLRRRHRRQSRAPRQPAARTVWGNAVSVLAGDLLLTRALDRTLAADPRVLAELIGTLRRLVDGEIVQLRGRVKLDTSETAYFRSSRTDRVALRMVGASGAIVAGDRTTARRSRDFRRADGGRLPARRRHARLHGRLERDRQGASLDLGEGKLTLPWSSRCQRPPVSCPCSRGHGVGPYGCRRAGAGGRKMGVCDGSATARP